MCVRKKVRTVILNRDVMVSKKLGRRIGGEGVL